MRTFATLTAALAAFLLAAPAAAEPCDGAKTQQELNACTQMDAHNAEAELDETRAKIYARLQTADMKEQTAAFEQARESFTSYVNAHCKAQALHAGDESKFSQIFEACRARGFRARSVELELAYGS